jgi:hypothetical protein
MPKPFKGEIKLDTIMSRYSLCGEGSASATTAALDVAEDALIDVERDFAAAMARD